MHTLLVRARTPLICKYIFTHTIPTAHHIHHTNTTHIHTCVHTTCTRTHQYTHIKHTPNKPVHILQMVCHISHKHIHVTYTTHTDTHICDGYTTCNTCTHHKAYTYMTVCKHMHTSHTHNGCWFSFEATYSETPGVVPNMSGKEPLDFFNLMFDSKAKKIIFDETTRYAEQYMAKNHEYLQQHKQARGHDWIRKPMVPKEVDALIAMVIAMGVVGLPTLR